MHAQPPVSASIVLDLAAGRLWIDDRPVELRPKTWEVLCTLIGRAGELVTKAELLDRVWADTAVSEGILNKSIGELRLAFHDSPDKPSCVETVPRRGYRWIGKVRIVPRADDRAGAQDGAKQGKPSTPEPLPEPLPTIIAREEELARLDAAAVRAHTGARQLLFVTGEAGAGKTVLVDSFLDRLGRSADREPILLARGECLETSGPHEPYFPLLDALERLCRDHRSGDAVTAVLRRCAPSWVARMPALASSASAAARSAPLAPGSMLRELTAAVDEIARERTLVLVVEDAHWADLASTDACTMLARRRDPARLLLIITKRSAEAAVLGHPVSDLRQDLVSRRLAEEISVTPFGRDALSSYLATRCPGLDRSGEIVECLLQQTAGNPLFARLVVDEWIDRELVSRSEGGVWGVTGDSVELRHAVPDSLRALLERQVAQLAPAERTVLEAASVRIGDFLPTSIASAAAMHPEEVETLCNGLAKRRQLLRASGTASEQYAFLHATIQNVVAEGLPRSRRRRLHLAAAEQLSQEYAGRPGAVSSLLAVHYEAAADTARAVLHLREAARHAMHRDAPRDAVVALERALALIDANPLLADPDRERVMTLSDLTHARQLAFGFGDPKIAEMWSRATELAEIADDAPERLLANAGGIIAACVMGRFADAQESIRTLLPIVDHVVETGPKKAFFFGAGNILYRVAAMVQGAALFEAALAMHHESEPVPGADLDALLMSQYAPQVALSGQPEYVRSLVRGSMERARKHSHYCEVVSGSLASWSLALLYDFTAAVPIAARTIELAETHGFLDWPSRPLFVVGLSEMHNGRVDEGAQRIRDVLEGRRKTGHWVDYSAMCCLFAGALMDAGQAGAEDHLTQASEFAATSGELFFESEVYRLRAKGHLLEGGQVEEAERLLRRACELADLRGFRWHALLAAMDLGSLLLDRGRTVDALAVLEPAMGAIVGGDDLDVLRRAGELRQRGQRAA